MSVVTQAHRDTYAELGAVRVEQVFEPGELDQATALIDAILAALRAGEVPPREIEDPVFKDIFLEDHDGYVRLVNAMPRFPALRDWLLGTVAAETAADVMGADSLRVWLDATFSKTGSAPETATPWHNDECTFSLRGEHLPSFWIALTDVDADNSPLITLSGSHRDAHRYYSPFSPQGQPLPPGFRPWQELLDRVAAPDAAIETWTVRRGDALLIHPKTIHASLPRRAQTDGRRLALTVRWIGSDVVWKPTPITRLAPFDHNPLMREGEPPPEALFPVVWRRTVSPVG